MFPEGEVAMTTKTPVTTCADLDEVKFRVMDQPPAGGKLPGLWRHPDAAALG